MEIRESLIFYSKTIDFDKEGIIYKSYVRYFCPNHYAINEHRKRRGFLAHMKEILKIFLLIIWCSLSLYTWSVVKGETSIGKPWKSLETGHIIIHYQSMEDLRDFMRKITSGEWVLTNLFSPFNSNKMIERGKKRMDALFKKVQKILGMHKKMKKPIVKIYSNKKQFHASYSSNYGKSYRCYDDHCSTQSSAPRAWYIYEYNTIYINVDDVHEGMMAHEMAHAIIDQFLLVRPPKATAEILARYVESHLHH